MPVTRLTLTLTAAPAMPGLALLGARLAAQLGVSLEVMLYEERNLLGDAHRVVPGQHDDHRAQLDALGLGRHVGEELNWIWTHRVIVEVMLNRPNRIEPKWFRHLC